MEAKILQNLFKLFIGCNDDFCFLFILGKVNIYETVDRLV